MWEEGVVPQAWRDAVLVPLPKKGDLTSCDNWRGISLLAVLGKVFAKVIQKRLEVVAEAILPESQSGFRPGRSTTDMIFTMEQLMERALESGLQLFYVFVDLRKAYDSVPRDGLWETLKTLGVPEKLRKLVICFHEDMMVRVRVGEELTEPINVRNGLRQGCVLAPLLFTLYAHAVVLDWKDRCQQQKISVGFQMVTKHGGCLPWSGMKKRSYKHGTECAITEGQFADDMGLVASTQGDAAACTMVYGVTASDWGLCVSWSKTKVMRVGTSPGEAREIYIDPDNTGGPVVDAVNTFRYLGVVMSSDGSADAAVDDRLAKAGRAYFSLAVPVFRDRDLSLQTKRMVYEASVPSSLLYGCHLLPLSYRHHQRMNTFHMQCVRRILGVRRTWQWKRHITNKTLLQWFGSEVLPSDRLRRQRLRWAGHVARMSPWALPQQVMFGWVHDAHKKQTRSRRLRWKDTVRRDLSHVGLDGNMAEWSWLAQDREKWDDLCNGGRPTRPVTPMPAPLHPDPDHPIVVLNKHDRFCVGRVRTYCWVMWEGQKIRCATVEAVDGDNEDLWPEDCDAATTTAEKAAWISRIHLVSNKDRYNALDCFDGHYSSWSADRIHDELGTKMKSHDDPCRLFFDPPRMNMCDT